MHLQTGGSNQLLWVDQSYAKASTPEVAGVKYLELNIESFLFLKSAKRLHVNSLHNVSK